jgi:hypothetical protein
LEDIPMRFQSFALRALTLSAVLTVASAASAWEQPGWDGKRHISYQQQKDLFYNYYAQPGPYNGAAAQLYVSPRPVPPNVGHTWITYQPYMPHEYLYEHGRSYYTYNRGAGWRRTNVRYASVGLNCDYWSQEFHYPRSLGMWALHNDYFFPGLRD